MNVQLIDLPGASAVLIPAPAGGLCQSLVHDVSEDVPAVTSVTVKVRGPVVADAYLCRACTDLLVDATAATDYAAG